MTWRARVTYVGPAGVRVLYLMDEERVLQTYHAETPKDLEAQITKTLKTLKVLEKTVGREYE